MALSTAEAPALVPPQYGTGQTHTHAKSGGGKHSHAHGEAEPGHSHPEDDPMNKSGIALLPLPGGKQIPFDEPFEDDDEDEDEGFDEIEAKRDFSQSQREEYAKQGVALSDGSYPIPDKGALRRAIASYGRNPTPRVKAHIVKRARALDALDLLPEDWQPGKGFYVGWEFEVKAAKTDGTLVLEGYGNTWDLDRGGDTTAPTAFNQSLQEYLLNPVLLDEHKHERPIGYITEATTDNRGIRIRAEVPPPPEGSEPWHVKVYNDIKRGVKRAFSMGGLFHRKGGARRGLIEKVSLYEFSVVAMPENQFSVFAVAEAKGLRFPAKAELDDSTDNPIPAGPTHTHRNGTTHAHPGGTKAHTHGEHTHRPLSGGAAEKHRHGAALVGHVHKNTSAMTKAAEDQSSPDTQPSADGGDVDQLLQAVADILDQILGGDLAASDKVDAVATLLDDFVNECQDRMEGQELPEVDGQSKQFDRNQKFLEGLLDQKSPAGHRIRSALARLRVKEAHMADISTATEPAEQKSADPVIDSKDVKALTERLAVLEQERRERELEQKAAAEAQARLEQEAQAEAERKQAEAAENKRLEEMVQQQLAIQKGKKSFRFPPSTSGPNGREQKGNLGEWLLDLVNAKRGDFNAYQRLSEGHEKAAADYGYDTKALAMGTGSAGGYLVPPQYWQQGIAEFRIATAKVRPLATVLPATSNTVVIPRETGISTVGWTAENASKPSTDQTFGQLTLNIFTLAGISKVSNQMLQFSNPSVDPLVRKDLGREIGLQEDAAFIDGTGSGQPTGILRTSGVAAVALPNPSVGSKLADGISACIKTVQTLYFGDPTAILAHPRTVDQLRTAKDANGRYIMEPGFNTVSAQSGGAGSFLGAATDSINAVGTVWGLPLIADANIPTTYTGTTPTGGTESPIIVGDFNEFYIFERPGISIDVSNEAGTSFEQNQTWFRGEELVGATAGRQPTAFAYLEGVTTSVS